MTTDLLEQMRARTDQMVDDLATLVNVESPTTDLTATAACSEVVDELAGERIRARAERLVVGGRTHLKWVFGPGSPRVVLVGHFDTVWPLGTLERWPFARDGDTATGPGSFDMKAGIVQMFHALSVLDNRDGIAVLLNSDEEIGSPSSRDLIRATAEEASAALVLEPSKNGALKTERKGVATYRVRVTGRAAHAGLDPEKGINAGVELAHQLLAIAALGDEGQGTMVTPTLGSIGSSSNSIPGSAVLQVDVRVPTIAEDKRVDEALRGLEPKLGGTSIVVERSAGTPPLPRASTTRLFALAQEVAGSIGLPPLEEASVGGGSDGNHIAGLGVRVLDGLGAVGDLAHAEGEHVFVPAMPERAALVAGLVQDLLGK